MNTIPKSDLQPQEKPGDGWFLIESAGRHPTVYEGKEVMQDLSAEVQELYGGFFFVVAAIWLALQCRLLFRVRA